jgi:hypothetical protein
MFLDKDSPRRIIVLTLYLIMFLDKKTMILLGDFLSRNIIKYKVNTMILLGDFLSRNIIKYKVNTMILLR